MTQPIGSAPLPPQPRRVVPGSDACQEHVAAVGKLALENHWANSPHRTRTFNNGQWAAITSLPDGIPLAKVWTPRRERSGTALVLSPKSWLEASGPGVYRIRKGRNVYAGLSQGVRKRLQQEARAAGQQKGMNPEFLRELAGLTEPAYARVQVEGVVGSRGALACAEMKAILTTRQDPNLTSLNETILPPGKDRSELALYLQANTLELRTLTSETDALPDDDHLKAPTLAFLEALAK